MVTKIRKKIRACITDFSSNSTEAFTYVSSTIFTIAQSNIVITSVELDGFVLEEDTDYEFDETTNKIEIITSALVGDILTVDYTFNKYSNLELDEYIRAALVWISIFSSSSEDYEVESGDIISPTPNNRMCDLIAVIASILIKPSYVSYKLPTVSVVYPEKMTKEQKIEKLLSKFNYGSGIFDLIEYDIYPNL